MVYSQSKQKHPQEGYSAGKIRTYHISLSSCLMLTILVEQGEGIFYLAVWRPGRANLRKYFAPLNGEIKPDTPRTRRLLREAGLL